MAVVVNRAQDVERTSNPFPESIDIVDNRDCSISGNAGWRWTCSQSWGGPRLCVSMPIFRALLTFGRRLLRRWTG
ncbi:hypothetical protein BH23CHL5_BH23CHL5_17910 [soil metagenome]